MKQNLPKWKQPPGMPRVLPRTAAAYQDIVIRGHLLGNTVVPLCAAKAFEILWQCISESVNPVKPGCESLHSCIFKGLEEYATRAVIVGKANDITLESSIELQQQNSTSPFGLHLWPSYGSNANLKAQDQPNYFRIRYFMKKTLRGISSK